MSLNIPFSWELKPGVTKLSCEETSIGVRCATLDLPPPPRLSKNALFCVNDLQGVLRPPPISRVRKGDVNKKEDRLVAAHRKRTKYSMNGKLGTDGEKDTCRTRTIKDIFTSSFSISESDRRRPSNSARKLHPEKWAKTRKEHIPSAPLRSLNPQISLHTKPPLTSTPKSDSSAKSSPPPLPPPSKLFFKTPASVSPSSTSKTSSNSPTPSLPKPSSSSVGLATNSNTTIRLIPGTSS
ncbi:hypothetical protein V6Z12_A05G227600 [Gossypium hirsutum]